MKKNFYIFSSGILKRKDNTICFEPFKSQISEIEENNQAVSSTSEISDEEFLIDFDNPQDDSEENPSKGTKN